MAKSKSIIIQNLEYFGMVIGVNILRLLPLKAAYNLAEFAGKLIFILDLLHSKRAVEHLLHAGVASDKASATKIARASFVHAAKVAVDVIKFDQYITPENMSSHVKFIYRSNETQEAFKNAKSFIFIGAHYGNWEISGLGCSVLVRPILSIMRPFDNKKIGEYFTSKRKQFKQEVCSKEAAARPILKAIKDGKAVGILADQHAGSSVGVETIFFGHPARTHTSPAILHLKTGAVLLVGVAKRIDDNFNYEFILQGPFKLDNPSGNIDQDIKILTQMFTSAIEEEIRRDPTQWLWSHRRWLDLNRYGKKAKN